MRLRRIGVMAALVVALGLGLALSLGLWSSWTASAQTTFYVNSDTGAGDPAPCDDPQFPSVADIQTVIDDDDVADGDTLVLCPGTYTAGAGGAVEVAKELTIAGVDTADRDDVVVQGTGGSDGFAVLADNVTIMHLKLVGGGVVGTDHGIDVTPAGPTTYNDAEFSDLEVTTWNIGLSIVSSDDTQVGPDNNIHGNGSGILLVSSILGGRGDVLRNNIIGPNEALGINLAEVDEAYVQENTLAGNDAVQISVAGESNAFIWNNNIEATTASGIHIESDTADTLVQIGGSVGHTNNFTGTVVPGISYYVILECDSENTVDATFNYWNGINSNAGISADVFNDEFDDPASGTADCSGDDKGAVAVHPFVTTLSTPTPTPTPAASVTPTPTPTPGNTRTINLSPQGWHTVAWSGANATAAGTALACVSGNFSIAYMYVGTTQDWLRYVPGNTTLTNLETVNKYDSLFLLISAANVSCIMPVE